MSGPELPWPIARAIAKVPKELIHLVGQLIEQIVISPNPKDAAERALQVATHEAAADAAVDAAFEAKSKIVGTGE